MTTYNNVINAEGILGNGQVYIGNNSGAALAANLTAGTGVSIANGANTITVNAIGGGLTWNVPTGTTQAAAVNNGYIANSNATGPCVITLPATAAVGSIVAVQGLGSQGWSLVANTGQTIQFGSVASSSAGSWSSTNQYDTLWVICAVANTTWLAITSISAGLTKA
jgi:hypothetical protein